MALHLQLQSGRTLPCSPRIQQQRPLFQVTLWPRHGDIQQRPMGILPRMRLRPGRLPKLQRLQSYLGHRLHGMSPPFRSICTSNSNFPSSPQEKATPPPSQAQPSVVAPQAVSSISETQPEMEQNGWEEPTTAEAPSWDEPKHAENWAPTETSSEAVKAELQVGGAAADSEIQEGPKIGVPEVVTEPLETTAPAASVPIAVQTPSIRPPVTPSPKLTTRPAVSSHRSSARHKIPDQPVTLPLSFGSGIEKVGMQFGSLSLGDGAETSQYVFRSCLCDEYTHNLVGLNLKLTLPFQSQRLLQCRSQRSRVLLHLLLQQRLLLRRP